MDKMKNEQEVVCIGSVDRSATAMKYPLSWTPLDDSPFGWLRFTDTGDRFCIINHSPNTPKLLGFEAEKGNAVLADMNYLQFFPWSEAEDYAESVRSLRTNGVPIAIRHHVICKDSSNPVFFECIFREARENGAEVYVATFENISVRGRTEAKTSAPSVFASDDNQKVAVRTFGYFEVFSDGQAVLFPNPKVKELLALLIDRRGGYITSEEAITLLWEDAMVDSALQTKYRKTKMMLLRTLEQYGIEDIVEKGTGSVRIVPQKIRCDLYDYLTGAPEFAYMFTDTYMANYSWGEMTLALLENKKNQ